VRESCAPPRDAEVEGDGWIGKNCTIGAGVRLIGPVVIGDNSRVG
jgi:serine acetyltransferase